MTVDANKTVLMIALDFPPCQSAGVQRTLKFAEYLVELGWQPIVLTVDESVYSQTDVEVKIPEGIRVYRSHSFDAARDFSIKGKYFAWSKVPDRWWSWAFTAIPLGKQLIKKYRPSVIWSTYPVATAHYIGYKLQQYSQLPWVADYRDPVQSRYDPNAQQYSSVARFIENLTIKHCTKAVFTTSRAVQMYQRLYPDQQLDKFIVIENGFDEANFANLPVIDVVNDSRFMLLHSGSVYTTGRDPTALFRALSTLKREGVINNKNFVLVFRGVNSNSSYEADMRSLDISDLIEFKANIPYKDSLLEMQQADALLLIQGSLFNNQIPGKAYEYLRSGCAILANTTNNGSTGQLFAKINGAYVAEHIEELAAAIKEMMFSSVSLTIKTEHYSRKQRTVQLCQLLKSVINNNAPS
jgi:glycosyltransferase involved in cell wall biosynthesis